MIVKGTLGMMNPMLLKSYIGPDVDGEPVAGILRHVAHYAKGTACPVSYVLQCYPNENGKRAGYALVSADLVAQHVHGLALVATLEAGNE